ncbi:hypothetical protein [Psittacicella gerlachiana]|uniref:UvrC family homology region profile domain-containing protein n=1 Tax=Psittacicella gerlachiana TaxID=2028574 RepID=A0A3A1YFE7_9GAMM|nr:hypothetical protein [Psittacicella gerlachiana]RIY34954.1 hypothetical protein CKF59_04430 [Psittacicella gerlachiana]
MQDKKQLLQALGQYLASDIDLFNLLLPNLFQPQHQDKLVAHLVLELLGEKNISASLLQRQLKLFTQLNQEFLHKKVQEAEPSSPRVLVTNEQVCNDNPLEQYLLEEGDWDVFDFAKDVDLDKLEAEEFADFAPEFTTNVTSNLSLPQEQQAQKFLSQLNPKMQQQLQQQAKHLLYAPLPHHEYPLNLEQSYSGSLWAKASQVALKQVETQVFTLPIFTKYQEQRLQQIFPLVEEQLDALEENATLGELFSHLTYLETSRLQFNYTLALAQGKQTNFDFTKFNFLPEAEIENNAWNHLSDLFALNGVLNKMHCFDISHDRGMFAKGSCVAANSQGVLASDYRHFNIENITPGDDYAAMEQAVRKRYQNQVFIQEMPLGILIDGGAQQLKVANQALIPILQQQRAIEVYLSLVLRGENLISHLAQKNYQLFPGMPSNLIALNAAQRVYDLYLQPCLSSLERGVAYPSCELLIRFYQQMASQEKAPHYQTIAYLVTKQQQQLHQELQTQEETFLHSFSELNDESQSYYPTTFSFLAQLPAHLTVKQLLELVLMSYSFIEFLYPIKTIGVTKQENRRYTAEKFLDGVTGEEIEIPAHSNELYYILKLRDAAHNYANRKRTEQRDRQLESGKDMLAKIPGLGAKSLDRLYTYFGTTGQIVQQLRTTPNPQHLLKELGIPGKAITNLLNALEEFPL